MTEEKRRQSVLNNLDKKRHKAGMKKFSWTTAYEKKVYNKELALQILGGTQEAKLLDSESIQKLLTEVVIDFVRLNSVVTDWKVKRSFWPQNLLVIVSNASFLNFSSKFVQFN